MARSAVCVGINEFKHLPMSSWLAGCVNDANDISAALKKFGFTSRTTTVLARLGGDEEGGHGRPHGDGRQGQAG